MVQGTLCAAVHIVRFVSIRVVNVLKQWRPAVASVCAYQAVYLRNVGNAMGRLRLLASKCHVRTHLGRHDGTPVTHDFTSYGEVSRALAKTSHR